MAVVTIAMITIIVKSVGLMMPASSPTASTIEFHQAARIHQRAEARANRHVMPESRLASAAPPNFPAVAARMMAAQISQSRGVATSPIWVRRPESAKKAGNRKHVTTPVSAR